MNEPARQQLIRILCRELIQAVAIALVNDRLRLAAAKWVVLWNKPRARRHLSHYLTGSGAVVTVETGQLLDEDRGIREATMHHIALALSKGQTAGRCDLPQLVFANTDWCYALGGMTLDWRVDESGTVGLRLVNRYHWSAGEKRISAPLHRAAERMKARGAAEFDIIGTSTRIRQDAVLAAASSIRTYRRFYM